MIELVRDRVEQRYLVHDRAVLFQKLQQAGQTPRPIRIWEILYATPV
jgi:hypothetical protein